MPKTTTTGSALSARRWQRHEADVPIRVIVQQEKKVLIVDGRGKSLSEGGMAMFAGTELRLGDQVAIEFTPPYSALPIRVGGRICTRTGYCYGLEFQTSTDAERLQAAEFRSQLAIMMHSPRH
jgi:hypothetical protein